MIILLSLRNIVRSYKNSLLLISLISFITYIFFIGNCLIDQSITGMENTYVDNLTGDLVVQNNSPISMSLFGANTPVINEFFTIPTLSAYDKISRIISEVPEVISSSGIVSGKAIMDFNGVRVPIPLIGVEAEHYFNLFPGIVIEEGNKLISGQEGIMITKGRAESIQTETGQSVKIGSPVLLTSAGDIGFKIREVPLTGIFSYTNPGPYMEEVVITDPQTVRSLSSILRVASEPVNVTENALELLDQDVDNLFSSEEHFVNNLAVEEENRNLIEDYREEIIHQKSNQDKELIGGDWNFIIIRLKDGISRSSIQKKLNKILNGFDINVVSWETAAGNSALLLLLVQTIFFGGIILVGIAGVITIVNIILISVFKRTREIGTLRAIGVPDSFIMGMLLAENLYLALIGGILGIGMGIISIGLVNINQWEIQHALLSALMGSPVLKIKFSYIIAAQSFMLAFFLGLISSIFPGWKVLSINPIEAVRRG